MSDFSSYATALKARDAIKLLVKDTIDQERPKYKYGIVTSLSPEQNSATVKLNGETSSVPVAMGAVRPTDVDQLVRVNGLPGDRYIEDVYGDVEIPDLEGSGDAGSISGVDIGNSVGPPTGLVLTTDSYFEDIWIDADWTAPATTDISGYDVELAENISGSFVLIQTYRVGDTFKRITGLKPATQYGVRIATINRIGIRSIYLPSLGYQVIITTVDSTIPGTPSGLTVGSGFRSLTFRWNEVSDSDVKNGHGQYEVHLDTSIAFGGSKVIQYTTGTIISFNDLVPGTTYYLRVRAIDSSGNFGAWSAVVSTTTAFVGTVDLTDAAITTAKLAPLAVNNSKLAALAVEAANLADSSVTSTKIANLAVGSAAIAALAVGTAHIADAAIITAKIGDLAVTTAKINDLAVNNAKIANLAVDNAKISDLDAGKINVGTLNANRIAANSLTVEKLSSSTMSTVQLTIGSSGAIIVGTPPTTGLLINNQGLRLYLSGSAKVILDSTGNATFEGTINASTVNGGTIIGATIKTATSGQRIAFEAGVISKLKFYTGDAQESGPAEANVGVNGSRLELGMYAPRIASQYYAGMQFFSTNTVGGVGGIQIQVLDSSGANKGRIFMTGSATQGSICDIADWNLARVWVNNVRYEFKDYNNVSAVLSLVSPNGSSASIVVYNGSGNKLLVGNGAGSANAAIEATSFDVASTVRGKTVLGNAASDLHRKIDNLDIISYKPNGDPGNPTLIGLTAEDLQLKFPEAVMLDAEGKPSSISIMSLIAVMLQKIQFLSKGR